MSVMGERELREREVLATLLSNSNAWQRLPDGFDERAFEMPEYRKLFESLRGDQEGESDSSDIEECCKRHPEHEKVVWRVKFGTETLNGRFRQRAGELLNHGVFESEPVQQDSLSVPQVRQDPVLETMNGLDIISTDFPEKRFLVKDLISEKSVNILAGEEGCGKSLLAMNLGIAIATGMDSWLSYRVERRGKVLYVNNELAFEDFGRRLKSMSVPIATPAHLLEFIVPKEAPSLKESFSALQRWCEAEKPTLLIVDCLYFAHDDDENDSSDMKKLMRMFLSLRDMYGVTLLLVHHTKKGAQYQKMHNDQMRGSSVFGGITDTVLQLRRSSADESLRLFKPTKFRHVADSERKCRLLKLDAETLWFSDQGETEEDDHIRRTGPRASEQIDLTAALEPNKQYARGQLIAQFEGMGYSSRTIDRTIKTAKENGILKDAGYGKVELCQFDTLPTPLQKDVNVKVREET